MTSRVPDAHAPRRVLIVGDSLDLLKPASDSSLALAEAALALHWEVHWCDAEDVGIMGADVVVTRSRRILETSTESFRVDPIVGGVASLTHFGTVWVRKDPPFDEGYKTLCWILSTQTAVAVANPAELLLAHHEKALQLRARAEGALHDWEIIPTCVTSNRTLAEAFLTQYADEAAAFSRGLGAIVPGVETHADQLHWVVKPWLGHGGNDVEAFADAKGALAYFDAKRAQPIAPEPTWMLQPFLPQVRTAGDRRVFVVRGEIVCDFVRIPKEGRIASNLAQGGRPELVPLSPAQRGLCERLAFWLEAKGIAIAGIDLIDTFVGEINVTSPTGLRTFQALSGRDVARRAAALLLGEAT
jgi:glutathione synthase